MNTNIRACLGMIAAVGLAYSAMADDPTPGDGPGWTGITNPMDVVAARQDLMVEIENLMRPIDTYTVDPSVDPDELREHAHIVSVMMEAVPHLFPPTTNLYEPDNDLTPTLALPQIWKNFATFTTMAAATTAAAEKLSETADADELRDGALALRASCDTCHQLHLRPYEESEVTEEDKNFDFDSIFNKE